MAESLAIDAATGGVNILATPAEVGLGASIGGFIGWGVGAITDILRGTWSDNVYSSDTTDRPSGFRKGTVQGAWDNAEDGQNGAKVCPTCGGEVKVAPGGGPRDWDVDHQPKWGDRDLSGLDRKGVLDNYNKGTRLRCPPCNRGDN
jgi:HNH/ENDO VII superfamily nuclease with conserved GHE residues